MVKALTFQDVQSVLRIIDHALLDRDIDSARQTIAHLQKCLQIKRDHDKDQLLLELHDRATRQVDFEPR